MIAWPRCCASSASAPISHFLERARDPRMRRGDVVLPAGVAGIGLRQAIDDREAVAVGLQRAGEVALRDLHVADLGV